MADAVLERTPWGQSSMKMAPRERVLFLPLDDGDGLLLDEIQRRIVHMNPTAAFVWGLLPDCPDRARLIEEVVSRLGVDVAAGQSLVDSASSAWWAQGLLEGAPFSPPSASPDGPSGPPLPADVLWSTERHYALRGVIRLRFSCDEDAELACLPLAHLEVDGGGIPEHVIDVVRTHETTSIYTDGVFVVSCEMVEDIAVWVLAAMVRARLAAGGFVLGVHAGVVGGPDGCVLLPAISGSGKTTLTAALVGKGYTYFSDELALLESGSFAVEPFPIPLSIKAEGRAALAHLFPEIEKLPLSTNEHGRHLSLLSPPKCALPPITANREVVAIVFPRYRHGAMLETRPLSTIEALTRLLGQCNGIPPTFRLRDLRGLMAWVGKLRCHEMTFGSLDEAVPFIEQLAGPGVPLNSLLRAASP